MNVVFYNIDKLVKERSWKLIKYLLGILLQSGTYLAGVFVGFQTPFHNWEF